MDFLDQMLGKLSVYIEPLYLVIFMLLGYLGKKHFNELLDSLTKLPWKPVYTIMIIAFIVGIPFAIAGESSWEKLLFTYTLGTSLHETIFQWIEKWLKKKVDG